MSGPPLPPPPSYQVVVRQRDQYKQWWLEAKGERNQWMDRAAEHGARELALRDQVADLSDALEAYYGRHKCGCNHPACNDCERDKTAEAALAKARGGEA
jgi:hypothetical protein